MNAATVKQPIWALAGTALLLIILPVEGTAALRNVLLLFVLLAFGVFLWGHKAWSALRFPMRWPWAVYAAVALVGLLWAVDPAYSFKEIKQELFFAVAFFWLGANLFQQKGSERWLLWALLVGNVLLVGYSLLMWASGEFTKDNLVGTFHTGVGNYTTYAITVAPFLVLLLRRNWKRGNRFQLLAGGLLLAANLASLYATQNRQIFIALMVQLLIWGWIFKAHIDKRGMVLLLLAIVAMVTLLGAQWRNRAEQIAALEQIDPTVTFVESRPAVWKFALEESFSHPLYGGGMGRETFKHLYPQHPQTGGVFVHTHNMLINRTVQLGLPGLLAFLVVFAGWLATLRKGIGEHRDWFAASMAMAAGVFLKNMTDDFFMRELGYLYWLLAGAVLAIDARPRNVPSEIRRCLVIRRDNIGDLLCTTPMMRSLREHYPAARIDALVNSYNAPVLANNPDLNHVYAYTKAKHRAKGETVLGVHWRRIKLMWLLRSVGYDLVILAGDGNVDRQLGLARWINAGCVIGFASPDGKARVGLDVSVPRPEAGHEVERTYSLLAPLGILGQPPAMILVPDSLEVGRAQAAINRVQGHPTIAIHISARKAPQRWPIERFAKLMQAIHQTSGARFVLFWSPGDENNPLHPGDDQKAAALMEQVSDLPVVPYPTHALSELIAALSVCDKMICSDGGAMHIGAALGLPIICLFGNSDASRWYPWGANARVLQAPSRDVSDVTVSQLLEAVNAA